MRIKKVGEYNTCTNNITNNTKKITQKLRRKKQQGKQSEILSRTDYFIYHISLFERKYSTYRFNDSIVWKNKRRRKQKYNVRKKKHFTRYHLLEVMYVLIYRIFAISLYTSEIPSIKMWQFVATC